VNYGGWPTCIFPHHIFSYFIKKNIFINIKTYRYLELKYIFILKKFVKLRVTTKLMLCLIFKYLTCICIDISLMIQ